MIFQNFGFNRQIVVAGAAPTFNYVSGAKVIFDIGNPSSYPGTGTTVTNLGSAGSASDGTINVTGSYQSNNGGVLYLTNTGRKRITFSTAISASFTTQAFLRHVGSTTSWGGGSSFYSGFPNIRGNNGVIVTNEVPNTKDVLTILWNGASANLSNIISPNTSDINSFHSYAMSSNGTNDHRLYIDTTVNATSASISRADSSTITSYINYDSPNNASTDMEFMGYLQYDRVLNTTELLENYNVFSSRF
jgi:hypothetical protein